MGSHGGSQSAVISGRSPRPGAALSALVILVSSLAGALVFPLSHGGGAASPSTDLERILLLAVVWALLAGWSLGYAALLRRWAGFSFERSLHRAALCHTPLLLCLGLIAALLGGEAAARGYQDTPQGQVVFQSLARGYVLAAPAAAQILGLAFSSRSMFVGTALFVLIAGSSIVLRVWNLDWGLPGRFHPDEYLTKALNMRATGDLNPHFFKNPSVMIYAIYAAQSIAAQHIPDFHRFALYFGLPLEDPRNDFLLLLVGRGISAVAGVSAVGVLYLAGREILGRKAALVGAALLGASFLHVRNSHYATNDVLAAFLLTASFLFSTRVYTRGRISDYLLAALLGGLATSTKYTASLFVLPLLVAHLGRRHEDFDGPEGKPRLTGAAPGSDRDSPPVRGDTGTLARRQLPLLVSGATALAAFLAGTPYALLDFDAFLVDFRFQLALGAEYARGQDPSPTPVLLLATLAQGLGVVPLLLALLGAVALARRDLWRFALLASVPVVYAASLSTQHYYYARFAVPLLPFLCLLAGQGATWVASGLGRSPAASLDLSAGASRRGVLHTPSVLPPAGAYAIRPNIARVLLGAVGTLHHTVWAGFRPAHTRVSSGVLMLLLAAALAQPLALSIQHDLLLGRQDTRTLAARWIEANAPMEATVAVETHSLMENPYGWRGRQTPEKRSYWAHDIQVFWPESESQMGRVLAGAYDYAIVTSWGYDSLWGGGSDLSGVLPRYRALDGSGTLVASFGPGRDNTDLPYAVDDGYTPFWHLFDRERPGPTVKIYQMRKPPGPPGSSPEGKLHLTRWRAPGQMKLPLRTSEFGPSESPWRGTRLQSTEVCDDGGARA